MREEISPFQYYEGRINTSEEQLKVLYRKRNVIARGRFVVFITICIALYILWSSSLWTIITAIICGIGLFLYLVSKDSDNKTTIRNLETILAINKDEINYLQQNFSHKYNGKDLEPANQAYAKDLDVFGQSSLFQYTNRCNSEQGIRLLAKSLLQPLTKEKIILQQKAIKELSTKMNWWQQFQAFGLNEQINFASESRINQWLLKEDKIFVALKWKLLLYIFPLITLTSIFLFLTDVLPAPVFSLLVLIFFLIAFLISGKIQKVYVLLSRLVPVVSTLHKQLDWFEKENFENDFLHSLKNTALVNKNASGAIKQLQNILERFDLRLNVFAFFILNTFFLWDLWQMIALNKWKKINKSSVTNWFNIIALLEVTGSFGVLCFNNPEWCFPEIADEHFTLSAREIGHPLISKQQSVSNDFSINGTARIDLITGSNMAGKSTFLRSIGVNMILAYAGSGVCAKSFTVSVAQLMSSMRIEDNLSENTSTFYAELKKLKSIIDEVNKSGKTFILLDEILRGTNSLDRHAGSKALIQQLVRQQAVAIIATHDIELSKLETEFPQSIKNYHFDVQVNREKLFFDYKLKEGICTSMNASILMKQIGIEMPTS